MSNQVNTVTQNIKEAVEGVVIGKYFITENKFKDFFKEVINTNAGDLYTWKKDLKNEVQILYNNYKDFLDINPMYAYTTWEYINKKYFNTTEVQILAAKGLGNSGDEKKQKVFAGKIERAVLTATKTTTNDLGKKIQVDTSKFNSATTEGVMNDVAKKICWNHYNEMVNTILNKKPSWEEKKLALSWSEENKQISKDQRDELLFKLLYKKYKIYNDIVFGKTNYGKMWEAYIHHLAHLHSWNLDIKDLGDINKKNPRDEEGNYFLTLLYAANVGANFTAGGDVIVVENGEITTNVQIKGIQYAYRNRIGNPVGIYIARDKYLKPLLEVLSNKDDNVSDNLINTLYNELKNSAWINESIEDTMAKLDLKKWIIDAYNETGSKMTWNEYNNLQHF